MKMGILAEGMTVLVIVFLLAVQRPVLAETLSIVPVKAPAINCAFDPSCKIVVNDFVANFAWSSTGNDSFLQSRTWPQGKPGTAAAGLYAYLYRIDLSKAMAATNFTCLQSFSIPFGPVTPVDYGGTCSASHVFVITSGGLGTIAPVSAVRQADNSIEFTFQSPFCNGGQPGKGGMSFFFGLASKYPPFQVVAKLSKDMGPAVNLQAVAPKYWSLGEPPAPKAIDGIKLKKNTP